MKEFFLNLFCSNQNLNFDRLTYLYKSDHNFTTIPRFLCHLQVYLCFNPEEHFEPL